MSKIIFAVLSLIAFTNVYGQLVTDPILMTIGDNNITKSEFVAIYQKNNNTKAIDQKSLKEYLDLYVNFKMKVKEAEEMGLDTTAAFKNELNGYRKQLIQPYLNDKRAEEEVLKEAYARMQFDVRASHILIKVSMEASPADTLAAWNKTMTLRKRILAGEPFEKIAVEASEDPSARDREASKNAPVMKGNKGDLGYFTVFDMVYPFETGVYNAKVGEVSMPVRTSFGYHLIFVTDKKPAMGRVKVAHLLVRFPENPTKQDSINLKLKVDSVFQKISQGVMSFEDAVAKYSDDKGSSAKGGVLPWFGVNRMVPEFIVAISTLQNINDVSAPVLTPYGWHIIKLLEREKIQSFDDSKNDLKKRVAKDYRSSLGKESFINTVKKEYSFKEDPKALREFDKIIDDSIFMGQWNALKAAHLKKVLFTIGNKTFYQKDFASYIASHQENLQKQPMSRLVNTFYKNYVDESCIAYEDNRLEAKYPEFNALMKEYRDGILLFDLTDQKVWSKAVKDSVGLENFYNANQDKYMWGDRLYASIYTCANKNIATEARKLERKAAKKNYVDQDILDIINKDSEKNLKIETAYFSKGDNPLIDSLEWKPGYSNDFLIGDAVVFVVIYKKLNPRHKSLSEAKGLVIADYQDYLEKEWIAALREKYPVVVNYEVLSQIK